METVSFILQLLILLGLGILAWIYRTSFTSYLNEKGKNVATKQDIEEITTKVESVRAQFLEHEARFSVFHQKRFEVEGRVFELLHDADEYIKHMVHPLQFGGDQEEVHRRKQAFDAFNEFSGFYWKHKIYLAEETCEKVEKVLSAMKDVANKYRRGRDSQISSGALDHWNEAWKTMESEVPRLRADLEQHFRKNVTIRGVRGKDV
jgi:hypothetical protein